LLLANEKRWLAAARAQLAMDYGMGSRPMTTPLTKSERLVGLRQVGWLDATLPEPPQSGDRLARVIAPHRASLEVHNGSEVLSAKPIPRLRHRVSDSSERPTVGDWVWLRRQGQEWIVTERLPRRSALLRGAAGDRYGRQVLAANIDWVIIVNGADRDYNPRRVERYLTLVGASGAKPLIVLTKIDQFSEDEIAERIAGLQAVVGDRPLIALNAKDPAQVAQLAARLQAGETTVLVGSSGAGKSTLTNGLAGTQLATAAVRANDGRGRHTTVSRQLVPLPGGACLIDTPGLREIKFTGDEEPAAEVFGDIEALAAECRFRDCGHASEPGCAVNAAIERGELDEARLEHWRKLGAESAERRSAAETRARILGKRKG
jgi:ribosome biogenesis GTPase